MHTRMNRKQIKAHSICLETLRRKIYQNYGKSKYILGEAQQQRRHDLSFSHFADKKTHLFLFGKQLK